MIWKVFNQNITARRAQIVELTMDRVEPLAARALKIGSSVIISAILLRKLVELPDEVYCISFGFHYLTPLLILRMKLECFLAARNGTVNCEVALFLCGEHNHFQSG